MLQTVVLSYRKDLHTWASPHILSRNCPGMDSYQVRPVRSGILSVRTILCAKSYTTDQPMDDSRRTGQLEYTWELHLLRKSFLSKRR